MFRYAWDSDPSAREHERLLKKLKVGLYELNPVFP